MILCADDYGISPAVSAGILELVEQRKISSVSCMVIGTHATQELAHLRRWNKQVEVGLHLVLTNDRPLSHLPPQTGLADAQGRFLSFPQLLRNAYRRSLDADTVSQEIAAQLACFESVMHVAPDYLDGHQHVQQLPVIREAVTRCAEHLVARRRRCYVRSAALPWTWLWGKGLFTSLKLAAANLAIAVPGRAMGRLLDQHTIPHNRFLLGFYSYEDGTAFEEIVRLYLSVQPRARDIFFCHPGYIDDALRRRDPLAASRLDALRFLQSPRCQEFLEERGIHVNTFFGDAEEGVEAPASSGERIGSVP